MFENLSKEQVEFIEQLIWDAYLEGWEDGNTGDTQVSAYDFWDLSRAKNTSCVIIAEQFQQPVGGE